MTRLKDTQDGAARRAVWKRTFAGQGTREDLLMILDDILYHSGWTHELPADAPAITVGIHIVRELGLYDPTNRETMMKMIADLDSAGYHASKRKEKEVLTLGEHEDRGEQI